MKKFLAILLVIAIWPVEVWALTAFPGAEGFGSTSIGGRSGSTTVYKVTNLNNSGTGSLRAACEASGPRYVVFMVSGDIHLSSDLNILNPYITIAGQTSPGGISISGRMTWVGTHDVIITHVHWRMGSDNCATSPTCLSGYGDALRIMNNGASDAYNVVIDHCSIEWGCDETLDVSSYNGETYGVTISNCLIAQGVDDADYPGENHALGVLLSGLHRVGTEALTVSFHHNYIAHFRYRFPNTGKGSFDVYNNVVYNYEQYTAEHMKGDSYTPSSPNDGAIGRALLNSRHNYYKQGPSVGYYDSCTYQALKSQGHVYDYDTGTGQMTGTPSEIVYSSGNIGTCYPNASTRENKYCNSYTIANIQELAAGWIASSPIAGATNGDANITTMTSTYASQVVSSSGANRISSTVNLTNDSVDAQIITDYTAGTGTWINGQTSYPTGWATYSTSGDNPTDSDSDGMIDSVEVTLWGSISNTPTGDADSDGYINIEEYLFYLGGYQGSGSVINSGVTITGGSAVR